MSYFGIYFLLIVIEASSLPSLSWSILSG